MECFRYRFQNNFHGAEAARSVVVVVIRAEFMQQCTVTMEKPCPLGVCKHLRVVYYPEYFLWLASLPSMPMPLTVPLASCDSRGFRHPIPTFFVYGCEATRSVADWSSTITHSLGESARRLGDADGRVFESLLFSRFVPAETGHCSL